MASRVYDRLSKAIERNQPDLGDGAEAMLAVALLVRTSRALTINLDTLLRPIGSSFARHQVLNIVDRAGPKGIPLGQIAHELFLHPATVTVSVDRLEKEGCVQRRSVANDRRTRLIVLTKLGRTQWVQGHRILVDAGYGIKDVPARNLQQFVRQLDQLMSAALTERDATEP